MEKLTTAKSTVRSMDQRTRTRLEVGFKAPWLVWVIFVFSLRAASAHDIDTSYETGRFSQVK